MAITLNGTTGIVSPKVNALDLELDSKNVVERGSNANGEYVRFADGTQICSRYVEHTNDGAGPGGSKIWPLPAAFHDVGFSIVVCTDNATSSNFILATNPHSVSEFRAYLRGDEGTGRIVPVLPPTAAGFFIVAIGRWY